MILPLLSPKEAPRPSAVLSKLKVLCNTHEGIAFGYFHDALTHGHTDLAEKLMIHLSEQDLLRQISLSVRHNLPMKDKLLEIAPRETLEAELANGYSRFYFASYKEL